MRLYALARAALTLPAADILDDLCRFDPARRWVLEGRGPQIGAGAVFSGAGGSRDLRIVLQRFDALAAGPDDPDVLNRCWWLEDGAALVARHRLHYRLSLPDADESWLTATEAARLLTRVMAGLACDPALTAVWNDTARVLFAAEHMHGFARRAAGGDVPLQLWLGLTYGLDKPGLVSVSTSGLADFMGFEVELWDAPWSVEAAGEKVTSLLRYLLRHGPVLGDAIGGGGGPGRVHYRFGTSRLARPQPVQAMFLEVAAPSVPVAGRIGENRSRERPRSGRRPGREP